MRRGRAVRERRSAEGERRQWEHSRRTPRVQLLMLNKRPGEAKREREKLAKLNPEISISEQR